MKLRKYSLIITLAEPYKWPPTGGRPRVLIRTEAPNYRSAYRCGRTNATDRYHGYRDPRADW